jgi:DNA-directed RNA polymerase subunit beta'
MALELFKPFIYNKLEERGYVNTIKSAKKMVERERPEVWDILDEVIQEHPVMLNRAPTLHRLGIQAFEPVLIEGKAIQLHPLVCTAFNADFDGDQMAVHVPLSVEAQMEARVLMMSTNNILSPASGRPIINPTQDIVLGLYYATRSRSQSRGAFRGKGLELKDGQIDGYLEGVYSSAADVHMAFDHGVVDLHSNIKCRVTDVDDEGQQRTRLVVTTVGRVLIGEVLPPGIPFDYVNKVLNKKTLSQLIDVCYRKHKNKETVLLADRLRSLGFSYATRAGISICMDDMVIPDKKKELIDSAEEELQRVSDQYQEGLITDGERYNKVVDIWAGVADRVTEEMMDVIGKETITDDRTGEQISESSFNPVYIMADSGARGSTQQMRQLAAMRGLMAKPSGEIIETPITANFREGLSVLEYFVSTHGARKGLADTALRTAESGYLTRRLIDVAQDVIVLTDDCGTTDGIWITEADSKEMNEPFRARLIGRTLVAAVPGFEQYPIGTELEEDAVDKMLEAGVKEVYCRSVLGCLAPYGVCRLCYGRNLAAGRLVDIGDAVGIIAAQSIGEPGTQLTMRTFHTGGIAGATDDITQGLPRVEELFESRVPKEKAIVSEIDGVAEIHTEDSGARKLRIVNADVITDEYALSKGSEVLISDGDEVKEGQPLAQTPAKKSHAAEQVLARTSGVATLEKNKIVVRFEARDEREYAVPAATIIQVKDGEEVRAGQQLTNGLIDPQDVLRIQGREAVHLYLVKEVQKVYRSTGVYINDKHIEIIVRQMLRRVRIDDPGDTDLLPNDLVDRFIYEETNARVLAEGGEPATAQTVLLGVTKASLNTESFLAAASFQETTRVLTEAAITGATDHLRGLKENVIIGKLIPAGTGLEQRKQLRDKQRADRLAAAMSTSGIGALGMGGDLDLDDGQTPEDGDGSFMGDLGGELGLVDSPPEE